jgi:hypothetical protein
MKMTTKKQSNKKTTVNSSSNVNRVFHISMTAVYNSDTIDENAIADGVFEAMTKVGNGLALLHVDDVKSVKNANEEIAKILSKVSGQTQESMASKTTDDGKKFVAVDEKSKPKKRKKNEQ